jgi:hypothetical protein
MGSPHKNIHAVGQTCEFDEQGVCFLPLHISIIHHRFGHMKHTSISYPHPPCFLPTNPLLHTFPPHRMSPLPSKTSANTLHRSASHIIEQRISSSNISDASAAGYGLAAVSPPIMSKRYCGAGAVEGQEKQRRKQKCDAEGIVAARMGSECFGACVMDLILVPF